ncbi:hypothetical protein ANO14919_141640 [Xylariales sp. No.14919]|nr:hypothetical protein ANO14919_141640 [Xylariales sp. No.14919]
MSNAASDAVMQGSNGSTSQRQRQEPNSLRNERLGMYKRDETYSVNARISGVGPSRSESHRNQEYHLLFESVASLEARKSVNGAKGSSGTAGS